MQTQQGAAAAPPPVITGLDIFSKEFPDEQWLVEPFIHRGLLLLCGPPKAGKTVMAHQLARSVITGESFAGHESTATGKVLWVNLEEREQDVQSKMMCAWGGKRDDRMDDLHFMPKLKKSLLQGGEDEIREYLKRDRYAFLVVDSLTAATALTNDRNVFQSDYKRVEAVKHICRDFDIAGIVLHHTNRRSVKETDGEGSNMIAGSGGLLSAADSGLILFKRDGKFIMQFRLRCGSQDDLIMVLDWEKGGWCVEGRTADVLPREQQRVIEALEGTGRMDVAMMAAYLRKSEAATKKLLNRMYEAGRVNKSELEKVNAKTKRSQKAVMYEAVAKFGRKPGEPMPDDIPIQ